LYVNEIMAGRKMQGFIQLPLRTAVIGHQRAENRFQVHPLIPVLEEREDRVCLVDRIDLPPLEILDQLDRKDLLPGKNRWQE
jgi:hypothetical protein